jgi:hypothetical protein
MGETSGTLGVGTRVAVGVRVGVSVAVGGTVGVSLTVLAAVVGVSEAGGDVGGAVCRLQAKIKLTRTVNATILRICMTLSFECG